MMPIRRRGGSVGASWIAWSAVLVTGWWIALATLDPGGLGDRYQSVDAVVSLADRAPAQPAVDLFALVMVGVLGLQSVSMVLGVVAHLARSTRILGVALRVALPGVRGLLLRTAGAGALALTVPVVLPVGSAVVLAPVVASAGAPAPGTLPGDQPAGEVTDPPVMRRLGPAANTAAGTAPEAPPDRAPSVDPPGRPVAPESASRTVGPTGPGGATGATAGSGTAGPGAARPGSWVVQPGEHLWHVATVVVEDHLARAAGDAEIARYHRVLIEQNRSGLPVPSNPDLVHPGHVLVLPDAAAVLG